MEPEIISRTEIDNDAGTQKVITTTTEVVMGADGKKKLKTTTKTITTKLPAQLLVSQSVVLSIASSFAHYFAPHAIDYKHMVF